MKEYVNWVYRIYFSKYFFHLKHFLSEEEERKTASNSIEEKYKPCREFNLFYWIETHWYYSISVEIQYMIQNYPTQLNESDYEACSIIPPDQGCSLLVSNLLYFTISLFILQE